MFCPNCGEKLPDDTAFCTNCGSKMRSAPLNDQSAASLASAAPAVSDRPAVSAAPTAVLPAATAAASTPAEATIPVGAPYQCPPQPGTVQPAAPHTTRAAVAPTKRFRRMAWFAPASLVLTVLLEVLLEFLRIHLRSDWNPFESMSDNFFTFYNITDDVFRFLIPLFALVLPALFYSIAVRKTDRSIKKALRPIFYIPAFCSYVAYLIALSSTLYSVVHMICGSAAVFEIVIWVARGICVVIMMIVAYFTTRKYFYAADDVEAKRNNNLL